MNEKALTSNITESQFQDSSLAKGPQTSICDRSQTLGKLFAALAKAQGQIKDAKKNADNPFYSSSYADLASVTDVTRKPLADAEITVMPLLGHHKDDVGSIVATVDMIIGHASGEFVVYRSSCRAADASPQKLGGAWTYLRRYTLSAIGQTAQVDLDGNENVNLPQEPEPIMAKSLAKKIRTAASKHTEFQAVGLFDEWIAALKGTELEKLSKPAGEKILEYLSAKKSDWPEVLVTAHQTAYENVDKAF